MGTLISACELQLQGPGREKEFPGPAGEGSLTLHPQFDPEWDLCARKPGSEELGFQPCPGRGSSAPPAWHRGILPLSPREVTGTQLLLTLGLPPELRDLGGKSTPGGKK